MYLTKTFNNDNELTNFFNAINFNVIDNDIDNIEYDEFCEHLTNLLNVEIDEYEFDIFNANIDLSIYIDDENEFDENNKFIKLFEISND